MEDASQALADYFAAQNEYLRPVLSLACFGKMADGSFRSQGPKIGEMVGVQLHTCKSCRKSLNTQCNSRHLRDWSH